MRRLNTRESAIDETLPRRRPAESAATAETPGIRVGTFVLRPTITQTINSETTKDGGTAQRRAFLETDVGATLTSDWGRHQLTVTSEGAYQRNISGEGEEQPSFKINGDLRLSSSVASTTVPRPRAERISSRPPIARMCDSASSRP